MIEREKECAYVIRMTDKINLNSTKEEWFTEYQTRMAEGSGERNLE